MRSNQGRNMRSTPIKVWTRFIRSSKAEDCSYSRAMRFPCKRESCWSHPKERLTAFVIPARSGCSCSSYSLQRRSSRGGSGLRSRPGLVIAGATCTRVQRRSTRQSGRWTSRETSPCLETCWRRGRLRKLNETRPLLTLPIRLRRRIARLPEKPEDLVRLIGLDL